MSKILFFSSILFLIISQIRCGPCSPKNAKVKLPTTFFLPAYSAKVNVTHDPLPPGCKLKYFWKVTLLSNPPVDISNVLKELSTTENKNNIAPKNVTEKTYMYKYQNEINVTMASSTGLLVVQLTPTESTTVSGYFYFTAMEIELKIRDAPIINYEMGSGGLKLDANVSKDKSYPEEVIHPERYTITWNCKPPIPNNPTPPANDLIWNMNDWTVEDYSITYNCSLLIERNFTFFHRPHKKQSSVEIRIAKPIRRPVFDAKCLLNCDSANAHKATILTWKCISLCEGSRAVWSIDPPDPNVMKSFLLPANIPNDKNAIQFLGNAFKPGQEVAFTATIGETTSVVKVKYRLIKLDLKLSCEKNCDPNPNPRVDIVIKAECCSFSARCQLEGCPCDSHEDCEPSEFDWGIRPVLSLDSFLDTTRSVLTIPANTFLDKTMVNITLKSFDFLAHYNFKTNEPKSNITLNCSQITAPERTCSEADPRDSLLFNVNCSEYCDMLNYTWTVNPNNVNYIWADHTGPGKSTLQVDPNTFPEKSDITFKVVTGKATESFVVKFRELVPEMKIECQSNCIKTPNPLKPTVLVGSCKQRCTYAVYDWTVQGARHSMPSTWLSENLTILTIPKDSINDETDVTVTLSSSSNKTTWKKKFSEPTPNLTIECVPSCGKGPLNPLIPTTLRVKCTEPSKSSDICPLVEYTWDIIPRPANFSWGARVAQEADQITFRENSFSDGEKVNVQVQGRKGKKSLPLTFAEPEPVIELKCTENCLKKVSHPSSQVVFQVGCSKNCKGVNFVWTLDPLPKEFNWIQSIILTENNDTLTIKPGVFADKDKVTVKVMSGKASKPLDTTFEMIPPEIVITCDPPCKKNSVFNPLNRVTLQANCTKYCFGKIEFEWSFDPLPKDFNWTKSIVMQINNESLLVLPEAFEDESNVTVTVTDSVGKEGKGNVTLSLIEPAPSIAIGCDKNCFEGDPLQETILSAKCTANCDNATKYDWALDPAPPNMKQNTSAGPLNISLTIHAETYKDGDEVNVTLTMRKANATQTIKYSEQIPEITLNCTENCSPFNPLRDVVFAVKCVAYCLKEEFMWTLEPVPEKFDFKRQIKLGSQNRTFTISRYTFNDTNTTSVTVTNRKASKTIVINFEETSAELKLICLFNCNDKLSNPLLPMMFNVSCIADCDRLKYLWYLLPPPPKDKWQSLVKYGKNNVTIYVKEGLYPDEGSTRVKVSSYKSEEYLDVNFVEPTPELMLEQNCEPDKCLPCNSTGCYPNPYEPISFNVSCVSRCQNLSFTWDVNPMLRDSSWNKNIGLPKGNITLTIKKLTYLERERVIVTAKSRKGSAVMNLAYVVPPPVVNLTCEPKSNCSESNIFKNTSLILECKYECEKFLYEWDIVPPQVEPWKTYLAPAKGKKGIVMALKNYLFKDKDSITFIAYNEKVSGNITINFIEFAPVIKIECEKNCKFNPRDAVQLKVVCEDFCDELNFDWKLIPPSKHIPLLNASSITFRVLNGSYPDNATVTATVKVRKSEASFTFSYQLPQWNGTCYIEPSNGTSAITKFAIECEDFTPEAMFRVYQKSPQDDTIGVLLTYGKDVLSKNFLLSKTDGSTNGVQVLVGIGWDTKTTVELAVTATEVTPPQDSNITQMDFIKNIIVGTDYGCYQDLLFRKQYFSVVQMASLLATALRDTDENFERHYIKHVYAGLLEVIDEIDPTQSLSLLVKIIQGNILKDPIVVKLATELLRKSVEKMVGSWATYVEDALHDFKHKALTLVSKLLSAGFLMKKQLMHESNDTISPDYPQFTELFPMKALMKKSVKQITVDIFAVATAVANTMINEGGTRNTTSSQINVTTVDRNLSATENIINFTLPQGGSYVTSPVHFPQILQKIYNTRDVILKYRLITFGFDPHLWKTENLTLSTETLELAIPGVSFVSNDLSVYLKVKHHLEVQQETVEGSGLIIKEYDLARNSLFTVTFKSVGKSYNVSLSNKEPNAGNFVEFGHTITEDKTLSFYSSTNVYVGVNTTEGVSSYSYTYIAADCYYWADGELAWKKDACAASPQLNPNYILCKCHHLSYFAARKYIPPLVPQGPSLSAGPIERNWVLTMATLALVVIFLLLLCWGHQQDEAFRAENVLQVLKDTIPGDKELYMVLIATGVSRDAGTTADVGISVKGSLATSRLHLLRGQNINLERNKEHFFIMYSPKYLGHLQSIKMWHNSQGKKPHWYCERVMIQHVKSREKYNFVVEQWFSLIHGNQTTHGMFKVSEKTQRMTFIRRVRETARADHHLLSLVFQRPRAGSYKETLMIGFVSCLTLMTITMLFVKMLDDVSGVMMVVIGLVSAVITLPITMLLQFLFRNSP